MANILLAYCTHEGQSRKIADALADEARELGHEVTMLDVSLPRVGLELDGYDAFVVGGSVHRMHHDPRLVEFVVEHLATLDAKPSAFFSVSLAAASDDAPARSDAALLAQDFFRETGWHPDLFDTMAGALIYSKYSPALKQLMRFTAWLNHGPTDASNDYELTDWDGVRRFARDVISTVESGKALPPDSPMNEQLRFYDLGVVQERSWSGPQDQAWRAAMDSDLRPGPLTQALDQLRHLAAFVGRQGAEDHPLTLADLIDDAREPLVLLDRREGSHVVLGAVGRFWTADVQWQPIEPAAFPSFDDSAFGKIAVGLQVLADPEPSTSRIRLEARIAAPNEQARRYLRVRWMLIRPAVRLVMSQALDAMGTPSETFGA